MTLCPWRGQRVCGGGHGPREMTMFPSLALWATVVLSFGPEMEQDIPVPGHLCHVSPPPQATSTPSHLRPGPPLTELAPRTRDLCPALLGQAFMGDHHVLDV